MSDLYDKEVDTLLKMGGQKALENQYKNISRRLDAISSENIHLKQVKIGFEDKIANLEEKIGYYKDSLLRTDKNCDKLYHENQELKQRIAELESRETKKPINGWICVAAKEINGQEYVKLEDFLQVVNDLQAEIGT